MATSQKAQKMIHPPLEADLGQEIAVYQAGNQVRFRVIGTAFGTSIILAALVFFTLRFSEMVTAIRLHGRAIVLLHAPALLILLLCLPLGVMILFVTGINWDNHLTLYERGLRRKWGLSTKSWTGAATTRLDTHIIHIKFGGNIVDIRIDLILENPHETLVIHNQYRDMADLIDRLRGILIPILRAAALREMANHQKVVFHHALAATLQGLEIDGNLFTWQQIDSPFIKNQKLILQNRQTNEKLIQINLKKITNLDLLLNLLTVPPEINV